MCDRYSAYKKLGRELGDRLTLAFCWVHARRDFIKCAAGNETLTEWERRWTGRIARLYRLNGARLEQHDAGLDADRRNPAFAAAHRELERALGQLFAAARRELDGLPDEAREGGPLRSLLNHRAGLSVFLDKPGVPMDNGGCAPDDLSPWLPWSMDAERRNELMAPG